jgi:hypothetical protein
MTKTEKLKKLDSLVLDTMIKWIESDETNRIPELGNAIQFLKANSVVEIQKQEDDALAQRKKKLEEAKKRREQQIQ